MGIEFVRHVQEIMRVGVHEATINTPSRSVDARNSVLGSRVNRNIIKTKRCYFIGVLLLLNELHTGQAALPCNTRCVRTHNKQEGAKKRKKSQ